LIKIKVSEFSQIEQRRQKEFLANIINTVVDMAKCISLTAIGKDRLSIVSAVRKVLFYYMKRDTIILKIQQ
jgi:hypothetical protein